MRKCNLFALAMFVLAVAGLAPLQAAQSNEQDEKAVAQANDEFYTALNDMFTGDVAPMKVVWSHMDDVTYMGPDGKFMIGWNQVSADWTKQANMNLGGAVRPEGIHTTIGADLATVECFEIGENIVDGKPTKVSIRATNVFRKENGQWKMIGHHTDTLPFLTK